MDKRRAKLILPLTLATAIFGGLVLWRQNPQPVPIAEVTIPSPSPAPVLTGQSSDGEIFLELAQKPGPDETAWILFAVKGNQAAKQIWSAVLPNDTNLLIPFNTVSPDNRFLFLKQSGPGPDRYLVLEIDGRTPPVEFTGLFSAKYPDYLITEVTGWGGINLIVFNTDKVSGGRGPSFWFEVPAQNFIRLSNRFN